MDKGVIEMNIYWIYRKDTQAVDLADIQKLDKPYAEKDGTLIAWVFEQESNLEEDEFVLISKLSEQEPTIPTAQIIISESVQ
jgi:hypothetical protein